MKWFLSATIHFCKCIVMKYSKTLLCFSVAGILILYSCKKEDREPPFDAASLAPGRAAIQFTASKAINEKREFNISNTSHTSAKNQSLGNTARNVVLEATDMFENSPTRKTIISMGLRPNYTGAINMAVTSGLPLANIRIESYSQFGHFRHSTGGTITITKFTSNEIEGSFTATFDDGTTINNGRFVRKF